MNKRIKELEKNNLDLNVNNEASIKKQEALEKKLKESGDPEQQKKLQSELDRQKEKLELAEMNKIKLNKQL